MEQSKILPVLDNEAIQKAANDYALKGATETIKEFYSGYNSPYKKAIEKELEATKLDGRIDLPSIIGIINDQLTNEIDKIANEAIAKTFIPLVKRLLTGEDPEIKFSYFLKQFIQALDIKEFHDCEVSVEKEEKYGWMNVKISHKSETYDLTLHEDYESKKEQVKKYVIHNLPWRWNDKKQTMKLSLDGATLEIPFTANVLQDGFVSFIAKLVMAKSKIVFDVTDFEDDMFPQDECHCH